MIVIGRVVFYIRCEIRAAEVEVAENKTVQQYILFNINTIRMALGIIYRSSNSLVCSQRYITWKTQ